MRSVFIRRAASARLDLQLEQPEAAARIADVLGRSQRVEAIARATRIETRAIAFPVDQIGRLTTIQDRNSLYQEVAPKLATQAVRKLLGFTPASSVDCLVTTSCTGYMVPGVDVSLAHSMQFRPDVVRLPITEAGCAGGVVALARATDYLAAHPAAHKGVVAAVELCSLAFQTDGDLGNLVSTLLFGDGAAAVLLEADDVDKTGLRVIDSGSLLVPASRDAIGFDLTDHGFAPRLSLDVADLLPDAIAESVRCLLAKNDLTPGDLAFWLIHPGGPRILEATQQAMDLSEDNIRWSWQALAESGNTSSVAILDVIRRYLADPQAPLGYGVVMAFGPGVSLELLLVNRC